MKAQVTKAFMGCRDGRTVTESFNINDVIEGKLAEAMVSAQYALAYAGDGRSSDMQSHVDDTSNTEADDALSEPQHNDDHTSNTEADDSLSEPQHNDDDTSNTEADDALSEPQHNDDETDAEDVSSKKAQPKPASDPKRPAAKQKKA